MSDLVMPPRVEFEVSDRGGEYLHKLRALAAAVDACALGYGVVVDANTDARASVAQIQSIIAQAIDDLEQIRADVKSIAQSGLPDQAGQANKALVSDGEHFSWVHTSGFNRRVNASTGLAAGDRLLVNAQHDEVELTLPEQLQAGDAFLMRNSSTSSADLILQVSRPVKTAAGRADWQAGDTVRIKPGEQLQLVMGESGLEAIV